MGNIIFEIGLAILLVAFAGILSNKLRSTLIPFYIIIGMAVGPHAPNLGLVDLRFVNSSQIIEFLGRIGVIFLLFHLGLEFSVGRLIKAGRSIFAGGTIYILINFTIGLLFGWGAGFPIKEVLIIAGITTISSSAIIAKVLTDLKRTANPETEMILGITMYEDIFLAVYLSIISGFLLSNSTSVFAVTKSLLIALGFMVFFIIAGIKLVPLLNKVLNIKSNEVFLTLVCAILFLVAGFAETIHVAEAIGALLIGLVLAETEHRTRIEHMIIPFRDLFGAVFFFSFGLTINPLKLGGAVSLSIIAVIVTLIGNFIAGLMAGRYSGLSARASSNIGLTLISRGEFAIIMANLSMSAHLLEIIQPFSALYVLILAILGPVITKESRHIYNILNIIFGFEKKQNSNSDTPKNT